MFQFPKFRRSQHTMKRMYNHIAGFYGSIEKSLGPNLDSVVEEKISKIPDISKSAALEYCCGSGLFTLKTAPHFKSVTAKDQSTAMLERAKKRAKDAGITNITFDEGNVLEINEQPKSYDYVFISFALHLFPLEKEIEILKKLYSVAKKAVIIIDHNRKWGLPIAIVEWFEGSYYDKFIKTDFNEVARQIGCKSFNEEEIDECMVLTFYCN